MQITLDSSTRVRDRSPLPGSKKASVTPWTPADSDSFPQRPDAGRSGEEAQASTRHRGARFWSSRGGRREHHDRAVHERMNPAVVGEGAGPGKGVRAARPLPQDPGIKAPIAGSRSARARPVVCPRDGVTGMHRDRARPEVEISDRDARIAGYTPNLSAAHGLSTLCRDARIAAYTADLSSATHSTRRLCRDAWIAGYRPDSPSTAHGIGRFRARCDPAPGSGRGIRPPGTREAARRAAGDVARRAAGRMVSVDEMAHEAPADVHGERADMSDRADGDVENHTVHPG